MTIFLQKVFTKKNERGEKMKIEGSVQELEQFFKKFTLKEKRIIKIDGTKVGEQIVPSTTTITNHLENHD